RQAMAERRVHVEMRVAEGRAQQQAGGIDGFVRGRLQALGHLDDAAVLHGDRHAGAPVGQGGVGDQQVKHGGPWVDGFLKMGWPGGGVSAWLTSASCRADRTAYTGT